MNVKRPFFSILVPTFNQAEYLGAALDSLLAQDYFDWEAIVVNDGSTDETAEVMMAYAKKDKRIKLFHKENGGVASALNEGLRQAKGEWICWLSSDDLFESTKLSIHKKWIEDNLACKFFFSHYKYLDEESGEVSEPPLWNSMPDRELQVIGQLEYGFVHGNSICIKRNAWLDVGTFNESLRQGQDYDMWLRLLRKFCAIFIPERMCITRRHAKQTTHGFPEACFYDSSLAAIDFLNQHTFTQMFPSAELESYESAAKVLQKAISVAANRHSFLYAMGVHPGLVLRLVEWLCSLSETKTNRRLKELFLKASKPIVNSDRDSLLRFYWHLARVAVRLGKGGVRYEGIDPIKMASFNCMVSPEQTHVDQTKLRKYLEVKSGHSSGQHQCTSNNGKFIAVIGQKHAEIAPPVKYGSLKATYEVAKRVMAAGNMVVIAGCSNYRFGLMDQVLFLGANSDQNLHRLLRSLRRMDIAIGISRSDMLESLSARKNIIYHHGPHFPLGQVSAKTLNQFGIRIVCVSDYSTHQQNKMGIEKRLLSVIKNGYERERFQLPEKNTSRARTLVFAGSIVAYKGTDIALRAFEVIRSKIPDAQLKMCGKMQPWNDGDNHLLDPTWLDPNGNVLWDRIEQQIPGVKYLGELNPECLASLLASSSLLIQPSRVPETFGMISIEAQACGCFPVLPRRGGFPETLIDGKTGFLYTENSPEGLADKIIDIWNKYEPMEEKRFYAAQWAQNNFSWDKATSSFLSLLTGTDPRLSLLASIRLMYLKGRRLLMLSFYNYLPGAWRFKALQRFLLN